MSSGARPLAGALPDARSTQMRFMMIYRPADTKDMEAGVQPSPDEFTRMGAFIREMAQSGVLLATDGLTRSALGARVRRKDGKFTVTDGPFTETKELIAGFAIVQVASKAEAVALSRRFLDVAGDGESEIRQMYDVPAFAA
jgi:hypothetical protein